MKSTTLSYRRCVGVVMFNKDGLVFVGKRAIGANRGRNRDAWQMPQGGIEENEGESDAAIRELIEETGVPSSSVSVVAKIDQWLYYDIPDAMMPKFWKRRMFKGQKQKWFLVKFFGNDADINVETEHKEFEEWRWSTIEQVKKDIVFFKKPVYIEVFKRFESMIYASCKVEKN